MSKKKPLVLYAVVCADRAVHEISATGFPNRPQIAAEWNKHGFCGKKTGHELVKLQEVRSR